MLDDVSDRAQRKQKKKDAVLFSFFFYISSRVSRCRKGDITKKKKPQVVKEKNKEWKGKELNDIG